MECREMISASYKGVLETLERALDGLTKEDLNWQSRPDCNSIGWLTWHLTRVQDSFIASMMGEQQLWIQGGWHTKFGRPPEANDAGFGQTPQDLAKFKSPDIKTLLGYHRAVLERSQRYISTLSAADMDRELQGPPYLPPKLGLRLIMVLSDGLQHAGQVAYIRGLRQGLGWQKF
jgi:hypothetical protein